MPLGTTLFGLQMITQEIQLTLARHSRWLKDRPGGVRADFS